MKNVMMEIRTTMMGALATVLKKMAGIAQGHLPIVQKFVETALRKELRPVMTEIQMTMMDAQLLAPLKLDGYVQLSAQLAMKTVEMERSSGMKNAMTMTLIL